MDRLQSMRVFVKVADNGSFARTAAQMDLSAAVVTRHVAELESHLGVRLLNRTTRSLSLTGAGQVYLERCRQIIDEVDEADALISSASRDPKGTLKVVAPVSFGLRNLAPLVKKYQEMHPKVVVDLTLTDRAIDLVEEGYDCGILLTRMINSESLISRVLAETRVMLCASPAYIAEHGEPDGAAPATIVGRQLSIDQLISVTEARIAWADRALKILANRAALGVLAADGERPGLVPGPS